MNSNLLTQDSVRCVEADGDRYHLLELQIALDPAHPAHSLPKIYPGEKVLDVGCGAGQTLIAACPYRTPGEGGWCTTCSRNDCPPWGHGLDVDAQALKLGSKWTGRLVLRLGDAGCLPYDDAEFDLVVSRVALVYTDLPQSVREMRRVLRPGGRIWLTMYPFYMVTRQRHGRNWKGLLYLAYVALNGVFFHFTLRTFALAGRRESWQTESAMRRLLRQAGFGNIQMDRNDRCFLVTAQAE